MKVIFLDIDGVLWLHEPEEQDKHFDSFSKKTVAQLNRILDECEDVMLVISSSWRHLHSTEWLRDHFDSQGINSTRIIGITPSIKDEYIRGHEIQAWLNRMPKEAIKDFIILDDDSDMAHLMDRLYQTKFATGLTKEIADNIIQRFRNEGLS